MPFYRARRSRLLDPTTVRRAGHNAGQRDRQVGGLLTLENAAGVDAGEPVRVRKAAAVAHQPAGRGELA
jgi:hypothetical protein